MNFVINSYDTAIRPLLKIKGSFDDRKKKGKTAGKSRHKTESRQSAKKEKISRGGYTVKMGMANFMTGILISNSAKILLI